MEAQIKHEPTVQVLEVCSFFILEGIKADKPIKQLKLQKLLYFAQGIYMASSDGQKLFEEPLQAWEYGPVVPYVYHEYKIFGNNPITPVNIELYCDGGIELLRSRKEKLPSEIVDFLQNIWNTFGKYHDIQLVELTHLKGSPWFEIYEQNNRSIPKTGIIINPEKMFQYFKRVAKNNA
jgi:uncharacterized phage-associated protein